jgi:hypothetical protein
VDEGNVIATAELTPVAAPIAYVHDNGFDFYNHISTAGRTTAKNSLNVIQEHRSGIDDRQAIDEMMNRVGRRHNEDLSPR